MTVGTASENDIAIDDPSVSHLHAVFERFPAGWCVTDVGSSNGTWLNGERIWSMQRVRHDDEIRIGQTRLFFRESTGSAEPETESEDAPPPLTAPRARCPRRTVPAALGSGHVHGTGIDAHDCRRPGHQPSSREAASREPVRQVRRRHRRCKPPPPIGQRRNSARGCDNRGSTGPHTGSMKLGNARRHPPQVTFAPSEWQGSPARTASPVCPFPFGRRLLEGKLTLPTWIGKTPPRTDSRRAMSSAYSRCEQQTEHPVTSFGGRHAHLS